MPTDTEDALIARLLQLPAEQRVEHLKRACAGVPGLWERLHELARVESTPSPPRETAPVPASDGDRVRFMELALEVHETGSQSIGPYKLLQKLGEGGFGTVWMAEQQEPVRRRVALKVIKSGMDTREVIARFEAERQALALMDHPNIARVFDAGATDLGQPYFVMELVRGIPITRYCDEHRLPTDERLNLFIAVCHAVQHAHQKGIIHRDLKPSNIIVTLHDGVPIPKIIDFGIAKATESRLTDKTLFTQFHAFMGTPAYTSPEQMEMSGLDVDTRSDIYSLGVLLYELLAGQPPFDPDTLMKSGLDAMRHTIREIDPPRPSQRVRTFSEQLRTTVARQRGMTASRLSIVLRGDLDWIVMHCLEKDRTRRYETANDLAADVRRHLANEPVMARSPSTGYRLRKFVRRHRVGFVASLLVTLSLIGALIIASVALIREHASREREVRLRQESDLHAANARSAAQKSAEVARFMTEMLSGVGPNVALGRDTTLLREILDRTSKRLESELRDEPDVRAELKDTLGGVYRDMGLYAAAEPLLREVVAVRRNATSLDPAGLGDALDHLGDILRRLNKTEESKTLLEEALAVRQARFGLESLASAETLFHLGQVAMSSGTAESADALFNQVLAIHRKLLGAEHVLVAETIAALGTSARGRFDHGKAAALHAEALAMYRRLLRSDHPAIAAALDSLGFSLMHLGRRPEAKETYREAFTLRQKLLGPQHPEMVVALLRYFGQIPADEASDHEVAVAADFIAAQRKVLANRSPLLAPALLMLSNLLDHPRRNSVHAEELRREAHSLIESSLANGPPLDNEVASAMAFFGWSKFVSGYASEGRTMCEEALTITRGLYGKTHGGVVLSNRILAWVYVGMRKFDEAIPQFQESLRVDRAILPEGHPFPGMDVAGLAIAYRLAGQLDAARTVLEPELKTERAWAVEHHRVSGSAPHMLGEFGLTLTAEGRFIEAETALRESLKGYATDKVNPLLLLLYPIPCVKVALGNALVGQTRFAEAEPLLLAAFDELAAHEHEYAGETARLLQGASDAIAALYHAWGKTDALARWRAEKLQPRT